MGDVVSRKGSGLRRKEEKGQASASPVVSAGETSASSTPIQNTRLLPSGCWRQIILLSPVGGLCVFALTAVYHSLIYLPQPNQPHRLTILDDLFCLQLASLIALLGLVVGWRLLRRFTLPAFSRLERAALAVGLGWGIISLAVLALGLAHLLYPWLLIILLGVALLLCWRDLWRLIQLLAAPAVLRGLAPLLPASRFGRLLAAVALLNLPLVLLFTLLLPYSPRGYDVYQYHWAVPRLYLLHHAIYALPGWAHANFPFNTEMLNTLALAFDAPVAALMIQALFGLLALVLLGGWLWRQFGALAAWLAVAICFASPLFTSVLTSGYAEPAVIYYGLASVFLTLAWLRQSQANQPEPSLSSLVLAGFFAGFGLGAKYWEGQIVAGVLVLLLSVGLAKLARLRRQGQPAWPLLRHTLLAIGSYSAAALLPLLPWLLKDWALLGNPIYPFLWGGPGWDAARTQMGLVTLSHFGPSGPFWRRLALAFLGLFLDPAHAGEALATPPNGLLLFVLLWPLLSLGRGIRALLRPRRPAPAQPEAALSAEREIAWLLLVAAVGYLSWVLSGASVDRYALPWIILLSGPAAVILVRACQVRWQRPVLRTCAPMMRKGMPGFILLVVLFFGPQLQTWNWWQHDPLSLLAGQVSLHSWESQHIMDPGYWATMDYINSTIPRDARLLLLGRGAGYFLEGRDYVADSGDDWIPYLETEGRTPAGMLALLQRDGFRYVVYEEVTLRFIITTYENLYIAGFLPAFRQFLATSLQEIKTIEGFHIYAVPPASP